MRGSNITNIYIIDSKEYMLQELNSEQKAYLNNIADKTKYNELRSHLLNTYGDDFTCTIKISFPEQEMTVFDSTRIQIS